jgi:hypothetical protein
VLRRCGARTLVAALLAFAVPVAPLARATVGICEACPRDCPMHAKRQGRAELGCHHPSTQRMSASPAAREHSQDPGLNRPGCRPHHEVPSASLADAVLPVPHVQTHVPTVRPLPIAAPHRPLRIADPPESPPPILLG